MRWYHILARICHFFSWVQMGENGRIHQRGLYRLIFDREENGSEPYLHRYYLLNTRWLARWFPRLSYRIVLHKCVLSDVEGLHDHPWSWWSKILEGGYWEYVPGDSVGEPQKIWRDPEDGWRSGTSSDFHRLVLPHEGAVSWSLFIMGPKEKDWGFQDREGTWVQWREYIRNRSLYV